MRDVGTSTVGPLGGWLGARTAVRHPVGWWLVWVVFAAGVNVAAAILATSTGNTALEIPADMKDVAEVKPPARVEAPAEVVVRFNSAVFPVPFGDDFTGTWAVATGELPKPLRFEITGPDGLTTRSTGVPGKEPNTWRVPEEAVPKRAPGETYTIAIVDQPGVRVASHKQQEIRFAPGSPKPTSEVFVKEFSATKLTVEPTERDVKFVATLSSPAPKMLVLKVTLAGAGKEWAETADLGEDGMEIRLKKGERTGSLTVSLKDRTKMGQPAVLLARLDVPADHRAPGDANPREAQTRLKSPPPPVGTDPPNIRLIVQAEGKGELTFDLSNPKEQPRTVDLSLSPPVERPVKVNLQYEGDAKVDQHFRVTETDNPKQVTIPPGGKKTVVFEAVRGGKMALQPDRKVKVTFVPVGDVEVPEGSHVQLTIGENLKARRLLVLVLAPGEGALVQPQRWANHLVGWEKDTDVGREKWARAVLVGGKLGDKGLTPDISPLVGGQEVKVPRLPDPGGKDRPARLNELLKLALDARRDLLKDLDTAARKEFRTIVVWRSTMSPNELQEPQPGQPAQPVQSLPQDVQDDLKTLKGQFAFVWFGGSPERHENDAVLNKVLVDLLRGWPGAMDSLPPSIRLVEPDLPIDEIPTWLKSPDVLDSKRDTP